LSGSQSEGSTSYPAQAGILLLGKILAALADAALIFVIVRILGKPSVGVLLALLLIYQTVTTIASAGFPTALMYFLPTRSLEERRAITRRFMVIMLVAGIASASLMGGVGAVHLLDPRLLDAVAEIVGSIPGEPSASLHYFLVLGLSAVGDLPARVLPNLLVVENRARAVAIVDIIRSAGRSLATILPLALGLDLWAVSGCLALFGALTGAITFGFFVSIYRGARRVPAPVSYREVIRFSFPIGLTEMVGTLNRQVDRYLIMLWFSAELFAEYQAGAWQIPFVVTIPYAVGSVYTPRFRELFAQGRAQEAIAIWRASVRKVSLLVVPITGVFVVGAEETMEILFTADYTRAATVFRIYCIYTMGRVAAFGNVIVAAGRSELVFRAGFFSLVSNVIISVPLLVLIGFEGPALGTLLAFIPMVLVYCWYIAQATGLRLSQIFPLRGYLGVVGVFAIAAAPAWAVKVALEGSPVAALAAEAAVVLVGFGVVGTLAGLIERADWRFLLDWLRLKVLAR
jgi:O-antigen/teichoic acid export membrane protein